jgi:hypothetical protein
MLSFNSWLALPKMLLIDGVCDQKTFKFFVSFGRIHGRTCRCKWSILKVKEGKSKESMVGPR